MFGAKGGLPKYNNRLEKELKQVKKELAKPKNTQVMKTKSGSKTSRIIKKVVEENEKE